MGNEILNKRKVIMTNEEAKKAGFRPTGTALMNCWHLTKSGSMQNVGVEFDNLSVDDFPTRAKAREALRKRKLDAERDARIKALVDGYKAKGGPITKEQLTDEVRMFLSREGKCFYSFHGPHGEVGRDVRDYTFVAGWPRATALKLGQAYWNRPDAEHAKWLADMQSQTTSITRGQREMLRVGDRVWGIMFWNADVTQPEYIREQVLEDIHQVERATSFDHLYFTRTAAQAALDKAKAEAEPLEWCEREKGASAQCGDCVTYNPTLDLQSPCGSRDYKDWRPTSQFEWGGSYEVCQGWVKRLRYRNPLWLAKHGHKGMVFNNNTNKWELDPLASHETPVDETQAKEVVTNDTQHSPSRPLSDAEFKNLVGRMSLPQLYDALKANGVKLEGIGLEPKKVDDQSVLEEAAKCVTGPRRRDYGTPDENFGLIASLWSVQLKHEVTPMQVAMCLILLKVARQANSPKRDNLVDIAGYAQCASELKGAK
jgi:hypothetical protein